MSRVLAVLAVGMLVALAQAAVPAVISNQTIEQSNLGYLQRPDNSAVLITKDHALWVQNDQVVQQQYGPNNVPPLAAAWPANSQLPPRQQTMGDLPEPVLVQYSDSAVAVDADDLENAFMSSAVAAQADWAGRAVVVSGMVQDIQYYPSGEATVFLSTLTINGRIVCQVSPGDVGYVSNINVGDWASIRGTVGGRDYYNVVLVGCRPVSWQTLSHAGVPYGTPYYWYGSPYPQPVYVYPSWFYPLPAYGPWIRFQIGSFDRYPNHRYYWSPGGRRVGWGTGHWQGDGDRYRGAQQPVQARPGTRGPANAGRLELHGRG